MKYRDIVCFDLLPRKGISSKNYASDFKKKLSKSNVNASGVEKIPIHVFFCLLS